MTSSIEGIWQTEPGLPEAPPPDSEIGFHTGDQYEACSWDQLVERCASFPATPWVWTAETPGLVHPESVPPLVAASREQRLHSARRQVALSGISLLVVIVAFLVWLPEIGFRSLLILVPWFLGLWFTIAAQELYDARGMRPASFVAARQGVRHSAWLQSQPAVYTRYLIGCLVAVMVFEILDRETAIAAAGLVKPQVWTGEIWRLLTGPMLHASFPHIIMNSSGLSSLGLLVEAHSRRAYLPVVFLSSALGGSLLSCLLLPRTTSVGASGGVMGLVGFLLVLGYRRRSHLPLGFLRQMAFVVVANGVLGVIGFGFMDNAAHLGGLLSGAGVGFLTLRLERPIVDDSGRQSSPSLMDKIALLPVMAAAAVSIWLILRSYF